MYHKKESFILGIMGITFILVSLSGCGSGSQGPQGVTGSQGPAGADVSGLKMVQLCSNYSDGSNNFPVFAMCLNNVLYGVYKDQKNSLLAEIVPGTYKNNSSDAPCNFTVKSNCIVEEN